MNLQGSSYFWPHRLEPVGSRSKPYKGFGPFGPWPLTGFRPGWSIINIGPNWTLFLTGSLLRMLLVSNIPFTGSVSISRWLFFRVSPHARPRARERRAGGMRACGMASRLKAKTT
jgi:hypothetical protein